MKSISYILCFFSILFVISCKTTTQTTKIEIELNKLQRTYASTNFQLDSLSSKVEALEIEIKKQKEDLTNLKDNM